MTIYKTEMAGGYVWVVCKDPRDWDVFLALDGSPQGESWKRPMVKLGPADAQAEGRRAHFPWLGSQALVMRNEAIVALREILEANGELLPLQTNNGSVLFAFNARKIDALDEEASDLERFPSSGRIMEIRRHAFTESAIGDLDIFRLPSRGSATYVNERFVRRVKEAGLEGLNFEQVWSS